MTKSKFELWSTMPDKLNFAFSFENNGYKPYKLINTKPNMCAHKFSNMNTHENIRKVASPRGQIVVLELIRKGTRYRPFQEKCLNPHTYEVNTFIFYGRITKKKTM